MSARLALWTVTLLLATGAAGVGFHVVEAGGHCPPEQRIHYYRNFTSPVTGSLVADIQSESYLTYRYCDLVHVDTFKRDLVFRAQGGAYHLVVHGEDFRDEYVLRPGDPAFRENQTRMYNASHIERFTYTGIANDLEVSSNELPGMDPRPPRSIRPRLPGVVS